jgi:hypothetical protein
MYPLEKYVFKNYDKTNEDGTKSTVVVALSTFGGKIVKGVAKCMDSDVFSIETGKKLAAARCDLKVCNKRLARASSRRKEVVDKLENLQDYYKKSASYYNDALYAAVESAERLKILEESLK